MIDDDKKKIMCLGAGLSQLPLIEKAVDLDLYVITVDYSPESPGHKISHEYVNCSTMDKECVLKAAKRIKIDGVVTIASNVAVPTVSFVAHELGLSGEDLKSSKIMYDKGKFRDFQEKQGFNCPGFVIGKDFSEVRYTIKNLKAPLIFKPVDSSGSRGISKLNEVTDGICEGAFYFAKEYSHCGMVCVEEFVEGVEIGGDAFLVDSKVNAVITHKYIDDFVPVGHELPTNISISEQERVIEEISATCNVLGYADGPLNFDVIVSPKEVTVLELSPRLGGNGIPFLVERGTNVDFVSAVISYSMGMELEMPDKIEVLKSCGSWVFGSPRKGRIKNIASEKQIKEIVPEVFNCTFNYEIGDEVSPFTHSGNQIGYILFDCPPEKEYKEIVTRISNALVLEISER